ncbi:SIP5 [Colletotrichum costaricense]|uniref:SIP5 n=2 Tax=Colletotrichum acutatum species complex TaxID=2707335 RepID=A0AAJ0DVW4_9PEZI|nr:SIP5 [Colletotrichum costaricense]XP_060374957.1 SIP5 [Colletotrichum tamarilloi]KAK1480241.1 SIP5 [Colletotrichum tamarilloi]KAK1515596.1 SIP5 [Colletotrichum costaricense]
MGNSSTKESRPIDPATDYRQSQAAYLNHSTSREAANDHASSRRQSRFSRADLNLLGLGAAGSSSAAGREDAPYERRETRQEREARRLERDRVAREKERERSLKEEHIDGGYLVTLGTYTGPEDFSKPVVRQLQVRWFPNILMLWLQRLTVVVPQIERRLAPFWRGLNDYSDNWTEYQLICAGRGLPIPAADEQPPPEFIPQSNMPASPTESSQNLANLTVPMGPRSLSVGSDRSSSMPGSGISSPNAAQQRSSSPFKPRAKALAAALSGGSRSNSSNDVAPREIKLPNDPLVNGQPLEVFLYKDATECPICFLTYPPYLNRTRCCDQPICSECFVQIKRADPHHPEHHGEPTEQSANPTNPEEAPEMLISEPAQCPYCQQTEFGVTYDAPPFRRGLSYAIGYPSQNTAMSSQSSLNSTLSPTSPTSGRRRAQSLSANAPNVVTTDRVRPDWSTKLAAQRAHQARRAAAATALHTAAFLMGNNEQQRGFAFTRPGRFSRRNTGSRTPSGPSNPQPEESPHRNPEGEAAPAGPEPGPRSSSGRGALENRRSRMEELEDMMFMEAVRLSLAAEEERKRKQEKAERKEAKKRDKEERKALKKQDRQSVYGPGQSSASGSSLSLGLGRRRGNSTTSNLRVEATLQGAQTTSAGPSAETSPVASSTPIGNTLSPTSAPSSAPSSKGKAVERPAVETQSSESSFQSTSTTPSLPIPTTSRGPSHLRQMSNASSISSSLADSAAGSYSNQAYLDPRASELSVGNRSEEGDRDNTEPMFNFRSLAEMVGVDIENGEANHDQDIASGEGRTATTSKKAEAEDEPEAEHMEDAHSEEPVQTNVGTLKPPPTIPEEPVDGAGKGDVSPLLGSGALTPEVTITPETPAPISDEAAESKRLGHESIVESSTGVTQ